MTKNTGPKTVPWGIPLNTGAVYDFSPLTITYSLLPRINYLIQFNIFPLIPYA